MKINRYKRILTQLVLVLCMVICCGINCYAKQKEYEYDDSGRITKVTYEDGSYETYEYDKNGNIIQVNYYSKEEPATSEDKTTTEDPNSSTSSNDNSDSGNTAQGDVSQELLEIGSSLSQTGQITDQNNTGNNQANSDDVDATIDNTSSGESQDVIDDTTDDTKGDTTADTTEEDSSGTKEKKTSWRKVMFIAGGVVLGILVPISIIFLIILLKRKKDEGDAEDEKQES